MTITVTLDPVIKIVADRMSKAAEAINDGNMPDILVLLHTSELIFLESPAEFLYRNVLESAMQSIAKGGKTKAAVFGNVGDNAFEDSDWVSLNDLDKWIYTGPAIDTNIPYAVYE